MGDQAEAELNRSQIETGTAVCTRRWSSGPPAIARTAAEEAKAGEPPPAVRGELIDAARWRAARYGVEGTLVDLTAGRTAPAGAVVDRLMAHRSLTAARQY